MHEDYEQNGLKLSPIRVHFGNWFYITTNQELSP